jgi:hypothetical protein
VEGISFPHQGCGERESEREREREREREIEVRRGLFGLRNSHIGNILPPLHKVQDPFAFGPQPTAKQILGDCCGLSKPRSF